MMDFLPPPQENFPDCMVPDGAEPCAGFLEMQRRASDRLDQLAKAARRELEQDARYLALQQIAKEMAGGTAKAKQALENALEIGLIPERYRDEAHAVIGELGKPLARYHEHCGETDG